MYKFVNRVCLIIKNMSNVKHDEIGCGHDYIIASGLIPAKCFAMFSSTMLGKLIGNSTLKCLYFIHSEDTGNMQNRCSCIEKHIQ